MSSYCISNQAKQDLIRVHQYGVEKFGLRQADKYFYAFFDCFDRIAARPFSFEAVDEIRSEYGRCVCGSDSIYFIISDDVVDIMTIVGR